MKRFILALFALVAVAVTGIAALAADLLPAHAVASPDLAAQVTGFLAGTVFPVITALALGLLSLLIHKVATKYKLEGLLKHEELLEKVAFRGITLAEERAAQYIGSKASLTGGNKMVLAIGHILESMPKVSEDKARSVVNALLAQIPGVGATGAATYTLPAAPAETPAPAPAA